MASQQTRFRDLARTGDPDLREELIEHYLPLARRLARRFYAGNESLEDLIQVASLALVKAVDRYDADRGTSFPSFAIPTITGELKRHFRDTGWAAHVPRTTQEHALAVHKCVGEVAAQTGTAPTVAEIVERTELSEDAVVTALTAYHALLADSLDTPVAPGGDGERAPTIAEVELGVSEPGYERVIERAALRPALRRLPSEERQILHMRFVEERTQTDIAKRLGVSQMQVSRVLRRILDGLRVSIDGQEASAA